MLNRRHLRVKVLQALYSYEQSEGKTVQAVEKELLKGIDQVYEMYIWVLSLLIETADFVTVDARERANRFLPTDEDKNANTRLSGNKFILALTANPEYLKAASKYRISWSFDPEVVKNVLAALKEMPEYGEYLQQEDNSIRAEKDIIKVIFKKIILRHPLVEQVFEEKFINWPVDKEVLQALVAKTLKNFTSEVPTENKLADLCANWEDDKPFIIDLFNKTIAYSDEQDELITRKTQNWESDRIAMMDTLLMRMAITELVHFPSIPVKVTINEYIEISKEYSTPKSNIFINGILDKILAELKDAGRIKKFGRGLLE
jgi:N utilization substance protein B